MLYYVQINAVCMIILLGVDRLIHNKKENLPARRLIFSWLVRVTMVLCVSDIFAWGCNGATFDGARLLLEISNIVYYAAIAWVCYLWLIYVNLRLHKNEENMKKFMIYSFLPLGLMMLLIFSNPILHIMFTISEDNVYTRGSAVALHWIITWGYLIVATVQVFRSIHEAKTRAEKNLLTPLLWFILLPITAAGLQMAFYGLSAMQCGITVSIVMVMSGYLQERISKDALTGLNNRSALVTYLSEQVRHGSNQEVSLFMLDIDKFKQINDLYGHYAGDRALQLVSDVLKASCAKSAANLFLCRYGGDEFVIAGKDISDEQASSLFANIDNDLKTASRDTITISIGKASGVCRNYKEVEMILSLADGAMYADKKNKNIAR